MVDGRWFRSIVCRSSSRRPATDYRPGLSPIDHRLSCFDVVAGQRALVPDVKLAATHDRVCPAGPALIGDAEPAPLAITGLAGLRESDDVVLAQNVKITVG